MQLAKAYTKSTTIMVRGFDNPAYLSCEMGRVHCAIYEVQNNEGKSAARLCCQGAALVPYMFCNFYLVKNCKTANNSATTEAREK
jgi:hypothetical protein